MFSMGVNLRPAAERKFGCRRESTQFSPARYTDTDRLLLAPRKGDVFSHVQTPKTTTSTFSRFLRSAHKDQNTRREMILECYSKSSRRGRGRVFVLLRLLVLFHTQVAITIQA